MAGSKWRRYLIRGHNCFADGVNGKGIVQQNLDSNARLGSARGTTRSIASL